MTSPLPGEHYCEKHQGNTAHYAKENCTVCQQAREIERLNTLIEELQLVQATIPEIVIEERDEARAKVWQLREELNALQTHFDIVTKAGAGKDAEIERLQSVIREAGGACDARLQKERERFKAEIERLHEIILVLRGDVDRARGQLTARDAEINRLRGLLRWWLTAGGADEDTIREALGDKA